MKIILASTSPYRVKQLSDFGLKFKAVAPKFDEETLKNLKVSPKKLSQILAQKKAESLVADLSSTDHSTTLVIGADQLVQLKNQILGKPHTQANAIKMLSKMSGRTHQLITSLCVIHNGKTHIETVIAKIKMRRLTRQEITAYVRRDRPFDCAGSYKLEKSGLSLIQTLQVSDPSSLTGLPLLALMRILLKTGKKLPFRL